MKTLLCSVYFILAGLCLYAGEKTIASPVRPYIEFIEGCRTEPVDYVMELFDRYDIVILSERHHAEMTQYDLINRLIADPRFAEKVGHVMTEIGSYNLNDRLNSILSPTHPDDSTFIKQALDLIRDMYFRPLRTETNYYSLLRNIYQVNKKLDPTHKIGLYMTDVVFDWKQTADMTHEQYRQFYDRFMGTRDAILAEHAIGELYKILGQPDSMASKALIILNSRHAYRYFPNKWNHDMAAQYIMDRFPGRVANVMINDCLSPTDNPLRDKLVNKGIWDAAFAACGNRAVGFDLTGTPFGADPFESIIKIKGKIKWQDMFTGFIFYRSFSEWELCEGIENLIPEEFIREYSRRTAIYSGEEPNEDRFLTECRELNHVECSRPYADHQKMHRQITRYLKPGTEKGK